MLDVLGVPGSPDGDFSCTDTEPEPAAKKRRTAQPLATDILGGGNVKQRVKRSEEGIAVNFRIYGTSALKLPYDDVAERFRFNTVCTCDGEIVDNVESHIPICKCRCPGPHTTVFLLASLPRHTVFLDIDVKAVKSVQAESWFDDVLQCLILHIIEKFECLRQRYMIYVRNYGCQGGIHIQFPEVSCTPEQYPQIAAFLEALLYFEGLDVAASKQEAGGLIFPLIESVTIDAGLVNYNVCGAVKDHRKDQYRYRLLFDSGPYGNRQQFKPCVNLETQPLEPSIYPCNPTPWPFLKEAGARHLNISNPLMYVAILHNIYDEAKPIAPQIGDVEAIAQCFLLTTIRNFLRHAALKHVNPFGGGEYVLARIKTTQAPLSHTINLFFLAFLMDRGYVTEWKGYKNYQTELYRVLGWVDDTNTLSSTPSLAISQFGALRAFTLHHKSFYTLQALPRFIMPVLLSSGKASVFSDTLNYSLTINTSVIEQCRSFFATCDIGKGLTATVQIYSKWFIHATLLYMVDKSCKMWLTDVGWVTVNVSEVNALFNAFFNGMARWDIGGFTLQMAAQGELYSLGQSYPADKRYYIFNSHQHSLIDVSLQITIPFPCPIASHGLKPLPSYISERSLEVGSLLTEKDIIDMALGVEWTEIDSYETIKAKIPQLGSELLFLQIAVRLIMLTAAGNVNRFKSLMGYIIGMLCFQVGKCILTIFGPGQNGKTFLMWIVRAAVQDILGTVASEDLKQASTLSHSFADPEGITAWVADDIKEGGNSGNKMMTNIKRLTSQAYQRFRKIYGEGRNRVCDLALIILTNYTFSPEDKEDVAVQSRLIEIFCPGNFSNRLSGPALDPLNTAEYKKLLARLQADERAPTKVKKYELWKQSDLTHNVGAGFFSLLGFGIFRPNIINEWRHLATQQLVEDTQKYGHLTNFNRIGPTTFNRPMTQSFVPGVQMDGVSSTSSSDSQPLPSIPLNVSPPLTLTGLDIWGREFERGSKRKYDTLYAM